MLNQKNTIDIIGYCVVKETKEKNHSTCTITVCMHYFVSTCIEEQPGDEHAYCRPAYLSVSLMKGIILLLELCFSLLQSANWMKKGKKILKEHVIKQDIGLRLTDNNKELCIKGQLFVNHSFH